ncbi:uncharacterized protein [Antedon mediterranea]|uniref:uncharacterized protein n=1 Tax=Antedon mediterranea TaxID=105859 RepID=UPI003AF6B8CC
MKNVPTINSNEEQGLRIQHKSDTEKIEEYLLNRQRILCNQASIFTPAIMNDRYKVDMSQMFTDMELLVESENKKDSKPSTIKDVADIITSTPKCKALIEGQGGIGKTSILRRLASNWATDQSYFKGKTVFLFNVRDLDKDEDIFDLITKQLDMKDFNRNTQIVKGSAMVQEFLMTHDDKIVLLLDGLDELRFNNKSLIRLFTKETLTESTVVVTTRSENIDEFRKRCNVHIRVTGFNNHGIAKYIEKHFSYFRKLELGKSLREELATNKDEVHSMCRNPMLLLLICILWEENENLPHNKVDLFKEILRCILNQSNKQQDTYKKMSKFEDAPTEYVNAMILLGKCMYNSLKINQLSIKKEDLKAKKDIVDMALKLGFVYEDAPISKSYFGNVFMPPHKLIVEALVGFYLCKLCETERMKNECDEDMRQLLAPLDDSEWEIIRESKHLNTVREFAIGFLGQKAGLFFNHWITNKLSTYRSLPSNLKFVKNEHEDVVVSALIDHMTNKDLAISQHIDDISTSIKLFIHSICPHVHVERHFIQLLRQLYCLKYYQDKVESFCEERASAGRANAIAHILGIEAKCNQVQIIAGKLMKHTIRVCLNIGVQLVLEKLDISGNNLHNINGSLLSSLLIMSPCLLKLKMYDCNLSGKVMNHVVRECLNRGIELPLQWLEISDNNLRNIDGTLLITFPKLKVLEMCNCNLSGGEIKHMTKECLNKGVQLALEELNIDHNKLRKMDGTLLCSLFIMSSKLTRLYMCKCNISGKVMNQMIRAGSNRGIQLTLGDLYIDGNDLSNIDSTLLISLLNLSPKLKRLGLYNCNLAGNGIQCLLTECSNRGIILAHELVKRIHSR